MTLSTFQGVYQEYLHSRLSVRGFCANQGFAPSTFYCFKLPTLGDKHTSVAISWHDLMIIVKAILDGQKIFTKKISYAQAHINKNMI
ncbi:hypothetical protein [Geofilum rhodophaeum]|uniref:hypothetical protein n=1 Tax=Geofilum rhodophaeum TaxID=1965019 RepID=UPI000B528E39|nr:hypothetical protein [Geofilum rhodophaeum]